MCQEPKIRTVFSTLIPCDDFIRIFTENLEELIWAFKRKSPQGVLNMNPALLRILYATLGLVILSLR